MATMRVAQVSRAKGPFEIVERPVPEPAAGQVRIKVQACGICHSDSVTKEGLFPGMQFPRVPGHELVGVIDAVGAGVSGLVKGHAWGLAGMAATAAGAILAGAASFSPAKTERPRASASTADMPSM